jgi:hypothetical protein
MPDAPEPEELLLELEELLPPLLELEELLPLLEAEGVVVSPDPHPTSRLVAANTQAIP